MTTPSEEHELRNKLLNLKTNDDRYVLSAIGVSTGMELYPLMEFIESYTNAKVSAVLDEVATIEATYGWGDENGLRHSLQNYLFAKRNKLTPNTPKGEK